jgi:hypothetical protein
MITREPEADHNAERPIPKPKNNLRVLCAFVVKSPLPLW